MNLRNRLPQIALSITLATSAQVLPPAPASAQDGDFDLDCALLLCIPGGFPDVSACNRAYDHMIDRLRNGQSPIGTCSMASGEAYDDYVVDYELLSVLDREAWSCPEGQTLYFEEPPENFSLFMTPFLTPKAFCYADRTLVTLPGGAGTEYEYTGVTDATLQRVKIDLTFNPGSELAYFSNWTGSDGSDVEPLGVDDDFTTVAAPAIGGDIDLSGPSKTIPAPACMKSVWKPNITELCSQRWYTLRPKEATHAAVFDQRTSCVTANGSNAMAVTAWGDRHNSLNIYSRPVSGIGDADAVRMTAQLFIPNDYEYYVPGGRLAFGIQIGGGCNSGGCLPEDQQGATVRVNYTVRDGQLYARIYSYHTDRKTDPKVVGSVWEGREENLRQYGENNTMSRPVPKGEWVTLVLDVVLNDPGRANGSSTFTLYGADGRQIDTVGFRNVTYRPDASWNFTGPSFTEKANYTGPAPKTQSMYYRDYEMSAGDSASCG